MGLSSIVAQQRQKEAESLKTFLALSLIGSLALHVGVLAVGLGNFLARVPELEEEPMEVVIVDPPEVEVVQPQQKEPQQQQTQLSTAAVGSGGSSRLGGQSGGGGGIQVLRTPASPKVAARNLSKPAPFVAPSRSAIPERQPTPVAPNRTQQPASPLQQEPAVSNQQLRSTLGEIRTTRDQAPALSGSASSAESGGTGNGIGNSTVGAASRGTGFGTGSGTGSGSGFGTGNGSGRGSGTGTGNGFGRGSGTGTGTGSGSTRGTPQGQGRGEGDAEGRGSGRLACRNCNKPKYPESAKRRGVEGAAKVAVDVDTKGNVTNVRVTQSSGDADLDEAAARAARRWKFDTPNGARQGVVAKVDFALEGSERHRQVQERERRRKVRRKRQVETATERKTPVAAVSAPRRTEATAPRRQYRPSQSPSRTQQAAPVSQSRLQQALRRQKTQPTNRQSNSQSKLGDSLRQLK